MPGSTSQPQIVFPNIIPDNPMNPYYLDQAEQHARRNPQDPTAQALWQYWLHSLQQIEAMRRAAAPGASGPSVAQSAPMPVPSNLGLGAEAPTPPGTAPVLPFSPAFGQGTAGAQGPQSTSSFHHFFGS